MGKNYRVDLATSFSLSHDAEPLEVTPEGNIALTTEQLQSGDYDIAAIIANNSLPVEEPSIGSRLSTAWSENIGQPWRENIGTPLSNAWSENVSGPVSEWWAGDDATPAAVPVTPAPAFVPRRWQ